MNIQFVAAIIPSLIQQRSFQHQTGIHDSLFDNSFAVKGPKLWKAMPYKSDVILDLELFKDQFTKFMLSLPDEPLPDKTANQTPIFCCAGEMTEKQLRTGVVGCSDGSVKS